MVVDSKKDFFVAIKKYYSEKDKEDHFIEEIEKLSAALALYFYKQYSDFRRMYPKSIKRYSKLKLEDLENPLTHDFIIRFSKENNIHEYVEFCSLLLGMSKKEFLDYEQQRINFEKMF